MSEYHEFLQEVCVCAQVLSKVVPSALGGTKETEGCCCNVAAS